MRPWAVWGTGLVLLTAAWGVTQLTPSEEVAEAPFTQTVAIGETAVGRELSVTVDEVVAADRVEDPRGWAADGTWVVVDLSAAARGTEVTAALRTAELVIDGVAFRASERPTSMLGTTLQVDVPTRGSVAFELPPGRRAGPAVLRFAANLVDLRVDSVAEVPIDLTALEVVSTRELQPRTGGGV